MDGLQKAIGIHARPRLSEAQAAGVLLIPFFLIYAFLLFYPFLWGIWISLHDWNLMKVAINPDAASFVGLKNYVQILWGKNIEWSPIANPWIQFPTLAALLASAYLWWSEKVSRISVITLAVASVTVFVLSGFHPGVDGRWYDRRFWVSLSNTIRFVAITVPSVTVISLTLAVATNRQTRAMQILRAIFFLSSVLSVTVVTLIWLIMFSPQQGLIANSTDILFGVRLAWLTNEHLAMPAIVVTTVWWSLGIAMILFLAGLQDINPEILEAAALDKAKGLRAFWYIILPNLRRTITVVVVLQIIAHFQVFGQAHLMTEGGPNDTTQVLVRYIYQNGFRDSELGRATAMAVLLFLIMGAFSLVQFLVGSERK